MKKIIIEKDGWGYIEGIILKNCYLSEWEQVGLGDINVDFIIEDRRETTHQTPETTQEPMEDKKEKYRMPRQIGCNHCNHHRDQIKQAEERGKEDMIAEIRNDLTLVLGFVERWNKQDKEAEVANSANVLSILINQNNE
jgi:hypothetical protein